MSHKIILATCLMFLAATLAADEQTAITTVYPLKLSATTLKPGDTLKAEFHFKADKPYPQNNSVFVHIRDEKGRMMRQMDHLPPVPMAGDKWRGDIKYTIETVIPDHYEGRRTQGEFGIVMGITYQDDNGKWHNQPVKCGPGVRHDGNETRCYMGKITVQRPAGESEFDPPITKALKAKLSQDRVPPGARIKITYNFEAEDKYTVDNSVFVHIINEKGQRVHQADHLPGIATGSPGWVGRVSYDNDYVVPELYEGKPSEGGTYRLVVGLYHKQDDDWKNETLMAGPGVEFDGNPTRCIVGQFTVDKNAPMPPGDTEREPTLDLDGYKLVFEEDFSKPLDVSAWGPGTRWIAHTPWAGDFGDARFMDPTPAETSPFSITDGVLCIEAKKSEEYIESDRYKRPWRAGLLASCDPKGDGFALQYGYFEARMKMPPGPGVWPAFWLMSAYDRKDPNAGKDGAVEVDVVEYYGHFPSTYRTALHVWQPGPHHGSGSLITTRKDEPSTGFHNYGVLVEKDFMTFYFDGVEIWKQPTPKEHNKPLMLLVNLALGSGYSVEHTPNPSRLYVEYVRAYEKK